MLDIKTTEENGTAVLALAGRLDTLTSPELESRLQELPDGTAELILDFEKLDYISSAGLRVLLSAYKDMMPRRGMKIAHVNDTIMEIFEVTGFAELLTII